jgi:hypothetical protein
MRKTKAEFLPLSFFVQDADEELFPLREVRSPSLKLISPSSNSSNSPRDTISPRNIVSSIQEATEDKTFSGKGINKTSSIQEINTLEDKASSIQELNQVTTGNRTPSIQELSPVTVKDKTLLIGNINAFETLFSVKSAVVDLQISQFLADYNIIILSNKAPIRRHRIHLTKNHPLKDKDLNWMDDEQKAQLTFYLVEGKVELTTLLEEFYKMHLIYSTYNPKTKEILSNMRGEVKTCRARVCQSKRQLYYETWKYYGDFPIILGRDTLDLAGDNICINLTTAKYRSLDLIQILVDICKGI